MARAALSGDRPATSFVHPSDLPRSDRARPGTVMQCPPPRPLPSSKPSIVTTSDARLTHLRDRERGRLGDDDAGLEGDDVVAIVPLLALLLVGVATGLDDVELRESEHP